MKCAGVHTGAFGQVFVHAHIWYSQPSVAKGILLSSQGTVVSDTLQRVEEARKELTTMTFVTKVRIIAIQMTGIR